MKPSRKSVQGAAAYLMQRPNAFIRNRVMLPAARSIPNRNMANRNMEKRPVHRVPLLQCRMHIANKIAEVASAVQQRDHGLLRSYFRRCIAAVLGGVPCNP